MLSDKAIQALRPDPERPDTKHHDLAQGLPLAGARPTLTTGAYPAVRLADARKQARTQQGKASFHGWDAAIGELRAELRGQPIG